MTTTMNTGAASLSDEQIEAAPNTITIDRRDLFDFVRGGIKAALEDGKAGEGMVASWYWQEATERAERVLANLGIFNAAIAAGGAQEAADTVSLTGAQLLEAFQFVAPDHPNDADQLECEVTIQRGNGHDGPGLYCWITEYPEEGAIRLDAAPAAASNVEQEVGS